MVVGFPQRIAFARRVLPLLLAAGAVAAARAQAPDSTRADFHVPAHLATLTGVVQDSMGDPIAYATVYIDGGPATTANDSGRFHLADIPPGKTNFAVRRMGYEQLSFSLNMLRDTTIAVKLWLHRVVQNMREMTVQEKLMSMSLYRAGFYDRMKAGTGYFLLPTDVNDRAANRIEELLYGIPGVTVQQQNGKPVAFGLSPKGYCRLSVFLDGKRYELHGQDEILIDAHDVHAVEIYPRAGEPPAQFYDPDNPMCGVIVLWTKID